MVAIMKINGLPQFTQAPDTSWAISCTFHKLGAVSSIMLLFPRVLLNPLFLDSRSRTQYNRD